MFESTDGKTPATNAFPRLLGDIGGTNARFGWQADPDSPISNIQVLACSEHATLLVAVTVYLESQNFQAPPCAAFGIANPVSGDEIAMTNHHWKFSVSSLRKSLGISRLLMLNDFTALALAIPTLKDDQLVKVGGGTTAESAAKGIIGPGTGLGVSGLLPVGFRNKWLPVSGEGGHVSLSAASAHEFAVIEQLSRRYGHVSAERVLSGPGLLDLYRVLRELGNCYGQEISTPAEVIELASQASTSTANTAVDMFCGFLGSVAGDLALTLGARGGVYIGGGIVPRLGERFLTSSFRDRFEAKGRFNGYLKSIPTWVISSPVSPALQGSSEALSLTDWR